MLRNGRWRSMAAPRVPYKRSFWLHGLCAAFALWEEIAQEFVSANNHKDPAKRSDKLRAFFNTALGVLYKDQQKEAAKERLRARAKRYDGTEGDGPRGFQVPKRAAILTAGVDVQHDRTEWVVRAWGVGEESWLVERVVLRGDTSQPEYWARFDELRLSRRWKHEGGADLAIRAMCIDAGDGTHSKTIYTYCAPRLHQHVFAIKGSSNPEAPMLPKKHTPVKPGRLYVLGVNALMHRTFLRLGADTPGPGFLHLNEYADDDYLSQLLSMRRVIDPKTRKRKWEATAGVPNEVADGEVYALAALQLGPVPVTALAAEVDRVIAEGGASKEPIAPAALAPTPAPTGAQWLPPRRGGWLRG
jgi:phage terminase large subunit GpA-like protein